MPRGGEGSGGERIRPRTATAEEQLQASGGRKDRDKKQKSGRGSNESDEGEATAAARTLFSELFGEKGEKIDMGKVVITMQKQILNNTQTLRMLIAGCMTTVLVPPSEESFRDGVATGPEYDRKVKAAGTNHNLGPPFAAVFLNMFEKLVEKHKGALSVEDRGFAEKLVKQMVADGHSFTTELVTVCICKETFETKDRPKQGRITIAYDVLSLAEVTYADERGPMLAYRLRRVTTKMLEHAGGTRLKGPPPRAQLERVLQLQLGKLSGSSGRK